MLPFKAALLVRLKQQGLADAALDYCVHAIQEA